MSMYIDNENRILRFDVPNSEALIDAQHCGIKDRTVGSYYMSEEYSSCFEFLSQFKGEMFIDIPLCINNATTLLNTLKNKGYKEAFKKNLKPQFDALVTLERYVKTQKTYFYKIKNPTVNDQYKYLKFDNEDTIINLIKTLIIGDCVSLYIKKIGENGFLLYLDQNPQFDNLLQNNTILKRMR